MKRLSESTKAFVNEWSINILVLLFGTTTLVQAFIVPTPSSTYFPGSSRIETIFRPNPIRRW